MVSNVGVEYSAAEEKFANAKTNLEKLAALEEMNRYVPKHKAAEKMRAGLSLKISKLKNEIEKEKTIAAAKKSSGGSASAMSVRKDGCAQIVILGPPNSGKSTLLNKLTGANAEVAPYEFTTTKPELGMMEYFGARIQIVDLPAIIEGSSEGKAQGPQVLSTARTADALVICGKTNEDAHMVMNELKKGGVLVNEEKPKILIKPSDFKGITIAGKQYLAFPEEQLVSFLSNMGVRQADVIISEENATLEKFTKVLDERLVYKKAAFINPFKDENLDVLKEKIFSLLGKILIYTKKHGEDADLLSPLVVDKSSTVQSVAELVHKDLAKNLNYAKVWGSTKIPGQRVPKDYVLSNRDIVEMSA